MTVGSDGLTLIHIVFGAFFHLLILWVSSLQLSAFDWLSWHCSWLPLIILLLCYQYLICTAAPTKILALVVNCLGLWLQGCLTLPVADETQDLKVAYLATWKKCSGTSFTFLSPSKQCPQCFRLLHLTDWTLRRGFCPNHFSGQWWGGWSLCQPVAHDQVVGSKEEWHLWMRVTFFSCSHLWDSVLWNSL